MKCKQCGTNVSEHERSCPTCGSTFRWEEAEVADIAAGKKRFVKRWAIRGGLMVVLVGGIGIFLDQLLRTYHPVIERQPTVTMISVYGNTEIRSTAIEAVMADGFITIPMLTVREHRLVRFFDPEKIQEIPMIAYVTPQGKLVTAMSKSEHCGSIDFFLKENNIHCATCPSYWNMASLEAYACCQKYYPDPFPSTVVGDEIRIDPLVIRSWKSRL